MNKRIKKKWYPFYPNTRIKHIVSPYHKIILYIVKHVEVTDEWYPTYPDGTVRVSFLIEKFTKNRYCFRFNVMDFDDTCLNREEYRQFKSKEDFKKYKKQMIEYCNNIPENIELRDWLFKEGFSYD